MTPGSHDPGGKFKWPLQPGVCGSAEFSSCGRYRHSLFRSWGNDAGLYVLWIGQNPSTAEADIDDPTIRREMAFTKAMGIDTYAKCNVMDYRATDPKQLLKVAPRSDRNLQTIRELADHHRCRRIIVAWGALPKPLRRYADDVISALHGKQLYCMGKTASGAPRHPLYLPGDAQCVPWP